MAGNPGRRSGHPASSRTINMRGVRSSRRRRCRASNCFARGAHGGGRPCRVAAGCCCLASRGCTAAVVAVMVRPVAPTRFAWSSGRGGKARPSAGHRVAGADSVGTCRVVATRDVLIRDQDGGDGAPGRLAVCWSNHRGFAWSHISGRCEASGEPPPTPPAANSPPTPRLPRRPRSAGALPSQTGSCPEAPEPSGQSIH